KAGLQPFLDQLGFNVVAFGCTSCIGNSGPLAEPVAEAVETGDLVATAVLSGNRNFEGRINPLVRANYLASPPLVVAYAIAGSINLDLTTEPLGTGSDGEPVYLRDIWPSLKEVADAVAGSLSAEMFQRRYADVFEGSDEWRAIKAEESLTYDWDAVSTYVKHPPFFE
ncbi:MAG: aconitase family protein, partial [Alphaproteobacteria bacterium]|nr:aconitase family protein [Alphaproteobacteria bacterium]